MSTKRTEKITISVTPDVFRACVEEADERTPSEWAREVIEAHLKRDPEWAVVLGELVAVRSIVINFQHLASSGQLTSQAAKAVVEAADRDKSARARALRNNRPAAA